MYSYYRGWCTISFTSERRCNESADAWSAAIARMPLPVFEQLADAATGTKQLRLYSDTSGKSAYILKIGTGKAAKPVRLPKDAPLAKAKEAVVATSFLASSSCSYRPTRMRVRVLLTLRAPKPASNRTQP